MCVCVMFALDIASCQCNGLPFLWISLFISEVSDERWRTLTPFIEQIKCCDDNKKMACIWAENDVRGYSGSGTTSVFSSSSFPSSILQPVFVLPRHTLSLSFSLSLSPWCWFTLFLCAHFTALNGTRFVSTKTNEQFFEMYSMDQDKVYRCCSAYHACSRSYAFYLWKHCFNNGWCESDVRRWAEMIGTYP